MSIHILERESAPLCKVNPDLHSPESQCIVWNNGNQTVYAYTCKRTEIRINIIIIIIIIIIVTSISLYQLVFLNTLQLAAGATGLFSQGWQQFFMGVLFVHWAQGWILHTAGGVAISVTCGYRADL